MEGKVMAAVGGCALLAGFAYIFQGGNQSKQTKKGQPDLFPGLINLGNTCYLNSVLQALASVSTFVSWLNTSCKLQQNNNKSKQLTLELSKLMQILNSPCYEQESYNPVSIFECLYSHGWVISTEQQDAHEVFQVITSTLADEEEFTGTKNWNSGLNDKVSESSSDESIVHRSRVAAFKIERKSWSPFTGLFANQLTCKTCLSKYPVKFDYFDTISLSLPSPFQFNNNYTLQDLLRKFICSEILESFECSSCDTIERKINQKRLLKKLSLGKLPHCLCFHINRTYWQSNGTPFKNNSFVRFSEILDIEPFLYTSSDVNPNSEIPTSLNLLTGTWLHVRNSSQKQEKDEDKMEELNSHTRLTLNTQYHLVAVIVHLGGVQEGHFITYRKLDSPKNDKWTLVSDERVQTVPLTHVLKSNAYMLFYERNKE